MHVIIDEKCTGCYSCYSNCPADAIKMIENEEGFVYPQINTEICIDCGICTKVCPLYNYIAPKHITKCFAAINNDLLIRKKSSSGGIFYLLANNVLLTDGVVYGVTINKELEPVFARVEDCNEIDCILGSKYVQAQVEDTYKLVKRDLEEGRKVLFSGTPCQVAGLKAYLKTDYEQLLTIDLICHGVPSARLLRNYVNDREKEYKSKITNIFFREKQFGWNRFAMKLTFENGKSYCHPNQTDPWMLSFNENIMLRKSCYECLFKTKERISDITLGDLWGIDNVAEELNDNEGVSLVIVQSEKGQKAFEVIKNMITIKEIDFESIQNRNSFHQIKIPETRDDFIRLAVGDCFERAYNTFVKKPFLDTFLFNMRLVLSNLKRRILRGFK